MFGYVYKTTNARNGKIYIGQCKLSRGDSYYGSGTYITRAIKKWGKENFRREILEFCQSREELWDREKYYIQLCGSLSPHGYNLDEGGVGGWDYLNNHPELKSKQPALGTTVPESQRRRISEFHKKRHAQMTPEERAIFRKRCSEGWTEEQKQKQSNRLLGTTRKSVREYLIDKWGIEKGENEFQLYLLRLKQSITPEVRKQIIESQKKSYAQDPRALEKTRIRQKLSVLTRLEKSGKITFEEKTLKREVLLNQLKELSDAPDHA